GGGSRLRSADLAFLLERVLPLLVGRPLATRLRGGEKPVRQREMCGQGEVVALALARIGPEEEIVLPRWAKDVDPDRVGRQPRHVHRGTGPEVRGFRGADLFEEAEAARRHVLPGS